MSNKRWTIEHVKLMLYYAVDKSASGIARVSGVSRQCVSVALKRLNVKIVNGEVREI